MNYKDKIQAIRKFAKAGSKLLLAAMVLGSGISLNSCQKDEDIVISKGEAAVLSLSATDLVLTQKEFTKSALTISWTRGTNQGTGSSLSYILQIDEAENDFASAQTLDLGPAVYEKSYTVESLNAFVRSNWNVEDGAATSFETRLIVDATMETVEDDTTDVSTFTVTPYKPVTDHLFIIGGATPAGWTIGDAPKMTKNSSSPWIFSYQGHLSTGTFKFAVSQDDCFCQDFYTKDADDDEMMIYNEGGSGDDIQWNIEEGGNYKVTVDLLELKISIEKLAGPAFSDLYIVGTATSVGWNMPSSEAFVQSADDPFIFTYETTLQPGEFKIATFSGDWCDGQWINASQPDQALTATDYMITQGCDGPDNKWVVTEETQGRYIITVNLHDNSISIDPVMLYLIGDGAPNDWTIDNPEPMTYANGVYTFTGELGAIKPTGSFKISKFKGDWCDGDWINSATPDQAISNTAYIITHGCAGPDNKWKLQDGDAGTYTITVDLDNEQITIQKQ